MSGHGHTTGQGFLTHRSPTKPKIISATAIRRRMRAISDPARAVVLRRFFKTGAGQYGAGDRFLGIRVPMLHRLAREYQGLSLRDIRALLRSAWHEERLLALLILVRQYAVAHAGRRNAIFRLYLKNTDQINNWDLVDCSAEYIVGAQVAERGRRTLLRLAKSKRLWERRIAMVATFHQIKRDRFDTTLRVARALLRDRHDLIQKAVGWMLREVGKRDRALEEQFLKRHGQRMPRTMLRYAIERFPAQLRWQYLHASGDR
jgi:3-methyladenine DNA glycosylase AlkD